MKKRNLVLFLLLALFLSATCLSACTSSRKATYESCPHF